MVLESSAIIMDAIFASGEEENRGRLLKIMHDFLMSEASKHSAMEKGKFDSFVTIQSVHIDCFTESAKGRTKVSDVNMEELVGNTEGFADSG
jgi:cohesin loading factor subunit SCC2